MDGCIPMEALGTLDALGPDDPKRRHAAVCARCSAMRVAYREFLRADAPASASIHDADARLAAFIHDRVERVEVAGAPRRSRRWFEMPMFRFAAAAAVIIAGVVANQLGDRESTVVRGDPRIVLTLEAPRVSSDGTIDLRWNSVPHADAYQIVLLRDDLSEVIRIPATSYDSMTLDRSVLPADATHWQVTALREGAVAAESAPKAFPR